MPSSKTRGLLGCACICLTKKKRNSPTSSIFRNITSGETISFTLVQMHDSDSCIVHLLQPAVETVFKKTGHKADEGHNAASHLGLRYL